MKKILIVIGIVLLTIVVVIGGVLTYITAALPDVGNPPDLVVEGTSERIERGKYLANSVTVCMDCHSTRDWSKFSAPLVPGTLGKGGERFDHTMGFPGVYYSKNVTPAGIRDYTDGELYRVITTGVNKDGKAMFPVMPYLNYGKMDDEDVYSIIAYLRSLEPIESEVPDSKSDFPMNFILNLIPVKGTPMKRPDPSDQVAYGGYLINAAACQECHTQVKNGQIIPELAFSGGREFAFPDGSVLRTSNITPDEETGIGTWTREAFVARFKIYADSSYVPPAVNPGEFNSIMPWIMYSHMTDEDLSAIYAYLKTVKPLKNKVEKYSPPKSK
jgi:mono/diheme cytochrome c family protein